MLNWVHVWTPPSWPAHDLNILLVQKAAMSRTLWGGALSWTYTKLCPNTPVAYGKIWFLRIWMYQCRFVAPSITTSSLLHPWWIASHTMTDGPRFPPLGWTQASISLSPCLRATGPDRHCGIGRTGTHHWRCSVSIVWGPTLCASGPTHGGVVCAPKWA